MRYFRTFCIGVFLALTVNAQTTVQLNSTKQTIAGFGINNNWASTMTTGEADSLFDSTKGIGLSILRIGMNSAGESFNGISCWTDIQLARARGLKYIIGSTWSPPNTWKTNNSENDGGFLKETYYTQWADRVVAFAAKVKAGSGMDLYAMSFGNEPDFASCGFTEPCNGNYPTTLWVDTQIVKFTKQVGPRLHALNPPVKLLGPEASEWVHTWSNTSACCSEPNGRSSSNPLGGHGYDYGHALYRDATAWAQLDILGVHQYDDQVATPWPSDVPDKKPVWQTEMSGVKWWPEQGTIVADGSAQGGYRVTGTTHIQNGVAVAGWIHNALTVGEAAAWCYWWYKTLGTDDNEGLRVTSGSAIAKRYFTFGNFSKFVRPGFVRVDITGSVPANVLLSAYRGNGNLVIVAINKNTTTSTVPITISGGTATSMIPYQTTASASVNLAAQTAVTVSGGILNASLPATSVTTFVGGVTITGVKDRMKGLGMSDISKAVTFNYNARQLNVSYRGEFRVAITTASGRTVAAFSGKERSTFALDPKEFGLGAYFAVVHTKNGAATKRFIVIK
jgi:glucuronoarabinoxylan endo-1,4-beta-xylanase